MKENELQKEMREKLNVLKADMFEKFANIPTHRLVWMVEDARAAHKKEVDEIENKLIRFERFRPDHTAYIAQLKNDLTECSRHTALLDSLHSLLEHIDAFCEDAGDHLGIKIMSPRES